MTSKFWEFFKSDNCRDILGYSVAFVFFYYLTIFALVAPSPELVFAVVLEICVYLIFLVYRLCRRKEVSTHARQIIANTLIHTLPAAAKLRRVGRIMVPLALLLALSLSTIDALAFGLAAANQIKAAERIYVFMPVSMLLGFHPAASMELLAGANVKAKKFQQAEKLYQSLFEIRERFYGPKSEPIADIYSDFGNLYAKSNNVSAARESYLRSIQLSEKLKVPQGWGKVLNRLGKLEVENGNYSAGLSHYANALKMREKIFGLEHPKVAETLIDMGALYHVMKDPVRESQCIERAKTIIRASQKSEINPTYIGALLSLSFLGLGYWLTSANGLLTRFAFLQLQNRLEITPASNILERNSLLSSLAMLASFRKLPALNAQYESESC